MTLQIASAYNGFMPQLTGQVIGYIRKPENYRINEYVQYVESPAPIGEYFRLGRDALVRLPAGGSKQNAWMDGDERPGNDAYMKVPFEAISFRTERYSYGWQLGYQTIATAQGGWKPKQVHVDAAVNWAMLARTKRMMDALESTSNWGTHVKTAAELSGLDPAKATWDQASDDPNSASYNAIWKAINGAIQEIFMDTNSQVKWEDMRLLISPNLAAKMAMSPEMNNYIRESPDARAQLLGEFSNWNRMWGLPATYRGLKIIVEDAVYTADKMTTGKTQLTEAAARSYVKSDDTAILLSRPGGLDGEYSNRSFSTAQLYHFEGLLQVEAFSDDQNRRINGYVTENVYETVAAPTAGYLITGVLPSA